MFVVKHLPVTGQRRKPVSPLAQNKNLFGLFDFATNVPSNKQRPAVANDKYRVAPLIHICGATLEAPHRMENSIFGRHPLVPGSRKSDVLMPTQIEITGCRDCGDDEDLPKAIDSATGVDASVLAAALVPWETKPSIRIDESATPMTATMRRKVRERTRSDRYHSFPIVLSPTN